MWSNQNSPKCLRVCTSRRNTCVILKAEKESQSFARISISFWFWAMTFLVVAHTRVLDPGFWIHHDIHAYLLKAMNTNTEANEGERKSNRKHFRINYFSLGLWLCVQVIGAVGVRGCWHCEVPSGSSTTAVLPAICLIALGRFSRSGLSPKYRKLNCWVKPREYDQKDSSHIWRFADVKFRLESGQRCRQKEETFFCGCQFCQRA